MRSLDLGRPVAYLGLDAGTPVFASGGERVGAVSHVVADSGADIFEGLVIDARGGAGGWRFADAEDDIDAMFERGVILRVDAGAVERMPEPSESAGDKLRRAWDLLSGGGHAN